MTPTASTTRSPFQFVRETEDPDRQFLAIWKHRFDFIHSEHPAPGCSPEWLTESRYPLSDRMILDGDKLYGVRFGQVTDYLMYDIDILSDYHPKQDRFAIDRMHRALEPLGLIRSVIVTSSYSQGLHLYFPFSNPQKSWAIAQAAQYLLQAKGFKFVSGQLEMFPNARPYSTQLTLYAGHRLPMQAGSYLVDYAPAQLDIVGGDTHAFVRRWQQAIAKNDVTTKVVERLVRKSRKKQFALSGRSQEYLEGLLKDAERGWTAAGQTNYLLGRFAQLSYVFSHILNAQEEFCTGDRLVAEIVRIAENAPGYQDYCNHRHEIEKRAQHWASCIERHPRYFPYGSDPIDGTYTPKISELPPEDKGPSWNQTQSEGARGRIRRAIADLLERNCLPVAITERANVIAVYYHVSKETLYKHLDLWHPLHLMDPPPAPPSELEELRSGRAGGAPEPQEGTSLVEGNGCKTAQDKDFLERVLASSADTQESGCNSTKAQDQTAIAPKTEPPHPPLQLDLWALSLEGACDRQAQPPTLDADPAPMPQYIQQMLFQLKEQKRGRSPIPPLSTPAAGQLQGYWEAIAPKAETGDTIEPTPPPEYIQQQLLELAQEAEQRASARGMPQLHRNTDPGESLQRQLERMRGYLVSGDRILMAEAQAWAQANPGLLDEVLPVVPLPEEVRHHE